MAANAILPQVWRPLPWNLAILVVAVPALRLYGRAV